MPNPAPFWCPIPIRKPQTVALGLLLGLCPAGAILADTPLGWISATNPSAYTIARGSLEVSASLLAVNDTIDFLNVREDLLAGQQRLVGNSGDLQGGHFELHYGLHDDIELFLSHRDQSFTVDLGTINSVNLLEISDSLDTTMQRIGGRWTFWRGNLLNADGRISAASLELSAFRNKSNDFNVVVDEVRLPNLTVFFRDPTTFKVANLEDDGWQARLIYSWPLGIGAIGTAWGSVSDRQATAATTSNITSPSVARVFEQTFTTDETLFSIGAGVTVDITPRLPLSLSYEFLNNGSSNFTRTPATPSTSLPGFLTGGPSTQDTNHVLTARLAYWLTPSMHVALTGNLYSNHFLVLIPTNPTDSLACNWGSDFERNKT